MDETAREEAVQEDPESLKPSFLSKRLRKDLDELP